MQRAIEFDPSLQAALNDLSTLEANVHRFDQSLYWARRAFPLAPNVPNSYYHVGSPLVWLDHTVAERVPAGRGVAVPRTDTGALRLQILLAILDHRRNRRDAAVERMRSSRRRQPRTW